MITIFCNLVMLGFTLWLAAMAFSIFLFTVSLVGYGVFHAVRWVFHAVRWVFSPWIGSLE